MRNHWSQNTVYTVAVLTFTTLLGTCLIGLVSHKLRNRNRSKVTHNTDGLRYVKTWHGWVERRKWEERQAKKAKAFQAKTDWLGWVPTHRDLGWIFWDPTGEGRRRYDEKRAKSLKRYIPDRITRHWPGFGQLNSLSDAEEGLAALARSEDQGFGNQSWLAKLLRSSERKKTDDGMASADINRDLRDGAEASTTTADIDADDRQLDTVRQRNISNRLAVPDPQIVANAEPKQVMQVSGFSQEGVNRRFDIAPHATLPAQSRARRVVKPRLWSLPAETIRHVLSSWHPPASYDVEDSAITGEEVISTAHDGMITPFNSEAPSTLLLNNPLCDYEKADSIDDAFSLYSGSTSLTTYQNRYQSHAGARDSEGSKDSCLNTRSPSGSHEVHRRSSYVRIIRERPSPGELVNGVSNSPQHSVQQLTGSIPNSAVTRLTGANLRLSPLPKDCITPPRKRPSATTKIRTTSSPRSQSKDDREAIYLNKAGNTKPPSRASPAVPASSTAPLSPKLEPISHPNAIVPSVHLAEPAAPPSTLRHKDNTKESGPGKGARDLATYDPPTFVDQMYRRLGWYEWNFSPGNRHDSGMGLKEIDRLDHKVYWNGRPHMDRVRIVEEETGLGKEGGLAREAWRKKMRLRKRKSMSDLHVGRKYQENHAQGTKPEELSGSIATKEPVMVPPEADARPTGPTQPAARTANGASSIMAAITPSNTVRQKIATLEAAAAPASTLRPPPVDIRIDTSAWMAKRPPVAGAVPLEEFRQPHGHIVALAKDSRIAKKENDVGEVGDGNGMGDMAEEEAVYTDGRGKWKRWEDWQYNGRGEK